MILGKGSGGCRRPPANLDVAPDREGTSWRVPFWHCSCIPTGLCCCIASSSPTCIRQGSEFGVKHSTFEGIDIRVCTAQASGGSRPVQGFQACIASRQYSGAWARGPLVLPDPLLDVKHVADPATVRSRPRPPGDRRATAFLRPRQFGVDRAEVRDAMARHRRRVSSRAKSFQPTSSSRHHPPTRDENSSKPLERRGINFSSARKPSGKQRMASASR